MRPSEALSTFFDEFYKNPEKTVVFIRNEEKIQVFAIDLYFFLWYNVRW